MHSQEFIDICDRLIGYDAVVMVDISMTHRYCITLGSLTLSSMRNLVSPFSDKYGKLHHPTTTKYIAVGDARVLYCDIGTIHTFVSSKKQKLHRAVKDFINA